MTDTIVQTRSSNAVNGLSGGGASSAISSPTSAKAASNSNSNNNTAPSSPASSSKSLIIEGNEGDPGDDVQNVSGSNSSSDSPKSNSGGESGDLLTKDNIVNNNIDSNENSQPPQPPQSSTSSSLSPPSPPLSPSPSNHSELTAAFEELRRENERLYAELANTQEVLDLFEEQRQLLREQMSMCICSGRDYHLERFRITEAEYRRVMPIKRLIEPEQLMKASGASQAMEQYSDGIVSMIDSASPNAVARYQSILAKPANGQLLKGRRGGANGGGAILTAKRPPKEITCMAISNNSPKSKVRSYLDRRAASSVNGSTDANGSILAVSSSSSSTPNSFNTNTIRLVQAKQQQQPQLHQIVAAVPMNTINSGNSSSGGQVNLKGGGQIIIRKRILSPEQVRASTDADGFRAQQHIQLQQQQPSQFLQQQLLKKVKIGGVNNGTTATTLNNLVPGQKFTILTTTAGNRTAFVNSNSLPNQQQQQQLQQRGVILTRRPIVNQQQQQTSQQQRINGVMNNHQMSNNNHQQNNSEQQDEEDVERLDQLNDALDQLLMGRYDALSQIPQPQLGRNANNNNSVRQQQQQQEEYDEDEEDEEQQNNVNNEDDDDEDIIFLDEVKNSNSTTRNIAVPLRPKIVIAGSRQQQPPPQTGTTASILGAALKSGYKPYPTNYSISNSDRQNGGNLTINNAGSLKLQFGQHQSISNDNSNGNNVTVISRNQLFQNKRPHLTNEERLDIINRLKSNESGARIARDYGITKQAVSAIKRRAQLMGDNFIHHFPQFQQQNQQQQSNSSNHFKNHPVLTLTSLPSTSNGGSRGTIVLNQGSALNADNSLVTRQQQLQQQKMANSNSNRQQSSSTHHQLRATTSSPQQLCLPVNPVAILKSQMAKSGGSDSSSGSSTPNSNSGNLMTDASASSPSARLKIDSKRLLLPRLLQGTETYQTYASTSKTPSETGGDLQPSRDESLLVKKEDENEEEEEEIATEEGVPENEEIVNEEDGEEDEEQEEEFLEAQQQQQSSTRSGKPFSFSMRQAMLDAGQENQEDEEEDQDHDQGQEEEEMYYDPSADPLQTQGPDEEEEEIDDVLLNSGEVDEEELARMAANMVGDEEDDEEGEGGEYDGNDGIHFNSSDDLMNMEDIQEEDDEVGGGSDDINNNPENDDDELQQLYSSVDGDGQDGENDSINLGGLADESIDPPLGTVDFGQYDSDLML